jgi:hypothetical protein
MFTFQFLRTQLVSDFHYLDLVAIDGQLVTMLMRKVQQPNVFGVAGMWQGDQIDAFIDGWTEYRDKRA